MKRKTIFIVLDVGFNGEEDLVGEEDHGEEDGEEEVAVCRSSRRGNSQATNPIDGEHR